MRSFRHLLALLLTTVVATLGLVVASTGPAAACSCVGGDIPRYAQQADTVFTGEVAEVDRGEQTVAGDGGVPTWMVVVLGATGTAIVAGLAVGAARLRRQEQSVS